MHACCVSSEPSQLLLVFPIVPPFCLHLEQVGVPNMGAVSYTPYYLHAQSMPPCLRIEQVGVGGSGKSSLTRFATFIGGFKVSASVERESVPALMQAITNYDCLLCP